MSMVIDAIKSIIDKAETALAMLESSQYSFVFDDDSSLQQLEKMDEDMTFVIEFLEEAEARDREQEDA